MMYTPRGMSMQTLDWLVAGSNPTIFNGIFKLIQQTTCYDFTLNRMYSHKYFLEENRPEKSCYGPYL